MAHDEKKCREIFALLSEYLDMEVPPEAGAEMEEHLADCAPCIEFAESLRRTVGLCRGYKPTVMPNPLSAEAKEELRAAWAKIVPGKPV